MLIDEKVARQTEKCRLIVVNDEVTKLKAEKEALVNKVTTLMTEFNTLQKRYDALEKDKAEFQNMYERSKEIYENASSSDEQVKTFPSLLEHLLI